LPAAGKKAAWPGRRRLMRSNIMADTPRPAPTEEPTGMRREAIVIRSWPKVILMVPTLLVAIICGFAMRTYTPPLAGSEFQTVHVWGLIFLVVLAVNSVMLF